MNVRRITGVVILLAIMVAALVACGAQEDQSQSEQTGQTGQAEQTEGNAEEQSGEDTTLARLQSEGVIRVGFANEAPYAYQTPDGKLTGEAVEVARAIFKNLGINEMEGVLTEFGSLIAGLQAGRFDAITAGMYITPDRCEQVLFANPEYQIGEGMIVKAGNPKDLHSYTDIAETPDALVGTGAGWFEYDYLIEAGVAEDQIKTFPDGPAGVAGIQAGHIDAFTGTAPTMRSLVETTGDANLEVVEDFEQPVIDGEEPINYGGAAFRKEDTALRDAFNAELEKLKESGQLEEIITQFEGFTADELPGDMTAEELCARQSEE